jgi:D-3-phosphoglycerate dehydrogenase
MYHIQLKNNISPAGLRRFPADYVCSTQVSLPDAWLVRSAELHGEVFPPSLLAVARAGAGVNNIPIDRCSEAGIVVFNTPGANANAVKELTLAGLLLSARKLTEGAAWVRTLRGQDTPAAVLAERGKAQFAGPELAGKRLGVIGLGAVGVPVANAALGLGMEVYAYDPYLSVEAAWKLCRQVRRAASLREIYTSCDFITLHLPLTAATRYMIDRDALAAMRDGVRLLNFARGELVQCDALRSALDSGRIAAEGTPAEIFDRKHDGRLGEFLGKVHVGMGFRDKVKGELLDILEDREVSEEELARLKELLGGDSRQPNGFSNPTKRRTTQ